MSLEKTVDGNVANLTLVKANSRDLPSLYLKEALLEIWFQINKSL